MNMVVKLASQAPQQIRGYSMLTVKAAADGKRIITGTATTPTPDRVGDIIEPLGVQFKNPMPLLHQHISREPVGFVKFDNPTAAGITFTAEFADVNDPAIAASQELVDRINTAWGEVASGLVRAVSIGFRTLEFSIMEDGGWRYIKTEVLELSLVTIPANSDCTIDRIKSIDESVRAALRHKHMTVSLPGASGPAKSPKPQEGNMAKQTVAEQITAYEAARAAKQARMEELMGEAAEAGTTLEEKASEEYDTLEAEITVVDKHLARLRTLQTAQVSKAAPVKPAATVEQGAQQRSGIIVKSEPKFDAGIRFARLAKAKMLGRLENLNVVEAAKHLYGEDSEVVTHFKAAVAAGTTISGNWAANLIGSETSAFADFLAYLRPATILGKFGQGSVPQLRKVPFREPLIAQTGGGAGYWVGEGKPKPLTSFNFTRTTLTPLKVANIAVLTEENIRSSAPSSDAIVRDALRDALAAVTDTTFIDPTNSGTSNVKPASITNGAGTIVSPGTDYAAIILGVRALFAKFTAANNPLSNAVWIMSSANALALSLMLNPLGQPYFPDMSLTGGKFQGLPVIVSDYVTNYVVLANANDIWEADDGEVQVDLSREASLEMLDGSLTQDGTAGTGASLVSLWQNNMVGIRAERTINWKLARASGVAYLSSVTWGGGVPNS